ncbi:unnamed protein product [Adineta steineri]|uniref:Uncharacterized protein n=1 Tax=Adineta steineri TaxID=433720 RepID=A0A813Z6Y3_9BILA|nr:unnamed protein product [Adineta steineri]
MYSTTIFLLAFGLLATAIMARPEHHHENTDNEISDEPDENKWSTYRLPNNIRVPHVLSAKLGRPHPTFTVKKIFNGKYVLISPALIFKVKETDTETSTTTEQTNIDQESTTSATIDETSSPTEGEEEEEEESTTAMPPFFKRRSLANNNKKEKLFFFDE